MRERTHRLRRIRSLFLNYTARWLIYRVVTSNKALFPTCRNNSRIWLDIRLRSYFSPTSWLRPAVSLRNVLLCPFLVASTISWRWWRSGIRPISSSRSSSSRWFRRSTFPSRLSLVPFAVVIAISWSWRWRWVWTTKVSLLWVLLSLYHFVILLRRYQAFLLLIINICCLWFGLLLEAPYLPHVRVIRIFISSCIRALTTSGVAVAPSLRSEPWGTSAIL